MICTFGFLWNCSRSERIRFFIISADDHSLFAVFQPGNEFMCEQMHFAESHTAAHDEKQRSILGKIEMAAHILFGCRARKCGPHREYREEAVFLPGCRRMQTPGSDPCAEPHSNRSSSLPRTECTRNRWQRQRRESSAVLSVSARSVFPQDKDVW